MNLRSVSLRFNLSGTFGDIILLLHGISSVSRNCRNTFRLLLATEETIFVSSFATRLDEKDDSHTDGQNSEKHALRPDLLSFGQSVGTKVMIIDPDFDQADDQQNDDQDDLIHGVATLARVSKLIMISYEGNN